MSDSHSREIESGRIEKTAVLFYSLLTEFQAACPGPGSGQEALDDSHLGLLMGLTMYLDDQIGPFRAERLMAAAPGIILQTDAHVTAAQREACRPLLKSLGRHLIAID